MKYTTTILVAVLSVVVASVQAADTNMRFFSQAPCEVLQQANDVHYVLANDEGKVAEGTLDKVNGFDASVEDGVYFLTAEQPSTGFFGTVVLSMSDDGTQMVFLLSPDGLTYLEGRHTCDYYGCDCMKGHEGDFSFDHRRVQNECKCDANCLCHDHDFVPCDKPNGVANGDVVNGDVTNGNVANPTTDPITGANNIYPDGSYPTGNGVGSWLGLAGLAGGIVALALSDSDDPSPVSPWKRPPRVLP